MEVEAEFIAVAAKSVHDPRDEILDYVVGRNKDKRVFYFEGWNGFGATSVLRSIAQYAVSSMTDNNSPPELKFGRTIYLDCSRWKSKRVVQRRIAEELKLDHMIMAMFDKQDEMDDFHGVDPGSRDVIRSVAAEIDLALRKSRYLMIFLNGSNGEIPFSRFGIPEYHGVVIWTFSERFPKMYSSPRNPYVRYTDVQFFRKWPYVSLTSSQFSAVFWEESASAAARCPCIQGIDDLTALVIDCCLYGLFLSRSFQSTTTGFCWAPHASNYWICDGIINIGGDRARDIAATLHTEISFDCEDYMVDNVLKNKIKLHPETPYLAVKHDDFGDFGDVYEKRPYRWVSITPSVWKSKMHYWLWPQSTAKNNRTTWKDKKAQEDMQIILAGATTIFIAFESTSTPQELPNDLFEPCSNLAVLILYCCAFSFVSPPFLQCHTLRFLGLDHCMDDNSTSSQLEGEDRTSKWIFLHNLWVLDLRYTDWDDILSEKKLNLMANLTELNMEGVRCWQYMDRLPEMLPYLQRLRIMKTTHQEENNTAGHQEETSSVDMSTSLMGTSKLQLLDLSGNSNMEQLPTWLSKASCSLEVLVLDGCAGLQDVVLPNFLLLRTFSFDGYGPATSNWTSTTELPTESCRPNCPPDADREHHVKTSTISLEGCKQLENLFLRGLVNLIELDLSGCAIKILDFTRMVVNVPRLKRLFLLGCEHLRAIIFGSDITEFKAWEQGRQRPQLDLLCIDTRPGGMVLGRPSHAQHKSFQLQVFAVIADARLTWSLEPLLRTVDFMSDEIYLDISISSSTTVYGGVVKVEEATGSKERIQGEPNGNEERQMYDDVFVKIAGAPIPMQVFPEAPAQKSDCHIEIGHGSGIMESLIDFSHQTSFGMYAQSLHVHDVLTNACLSVKKWYSLRWCRVERCPNISAVFPQGCSEDHKLETIWTSDLLMARCIWSKGKFSPLDASNYGFGRLQHLHLRSCPSLRFALPLWHHFNSLKTLHIIHCGDLRHVFEEDDKCAIEKGMAFHGAEFPSLTTIYLHDLPNLRQICDVKMLAPALETIRMRGCWGLRRMPCLGDRVGRRKPAVEVEKDVWDALEWDGVDAGHHPSLYEVPVHSRHYKRRMLRGTVLR